MSCEESGDHDEKQYQGKREDDEEIRVKTHEGVDGKE
jgi:hypothetical protein